MNRDKLKSVIRKLVLNEMTKADYGVGKVSTEKELAKDVDKAVGKAGEAVENPLNGKVSVDDGKGGKKFQAEITENGDGLFDVNLVKNGSQRFTARQLDAEKLGEFLKGHAKDDKSYTEKAWEKGKAPIKKEENEDKEEVSSKVDDTDEMEETKEKKQVDVADKDTKKAEEKPKKELAPVDDENAPELGGELVDKIEKIIDRVIKNKVKADSKTAHLKADKDMESPDKLKVKVKDTPALKDSKK